MNVNVWQISGGPASRSYADVFLRHGVGLIGPGDAGKEINISQIRLHRSLIHD